MRKRYESGWRVRPSASKTGRVGFCFLCLVSLILLGVFTPACDSSSPGPKPSAAKQGVSEGVQWKDLFNGAPESLAAYEEAQTLLRSGRYAKAAAKFEKLLEGSPDAPWAELTRFQIAQAFKLAGDYTAAIRHLDLFLEQYPQSSDAPEALIGKGEIYFQMGDVQQGPSRRMYLAKALKIFQEVREKYPDDKDVQAKTFYLLGSTFTAEEEFPKARSAYRTVVDVYPDSSYGVKALYSLAGISLREGDMNEAERLFGELTERYPTSRYAGKARQKLEGIGLVGYKAPPLEVKEWIGPPPDVAEGYKGKPVLLSFWAIWCPHCRRNLPKMDRLARDYSPKGLRIVGITRERKENGIDKIKEYIRSHPTHFTTGVDDGGKTSRSFLVSNIPRTVLIDSEGKVAWYGHPDYLTDKVIEDVLKGSS